MSSKLEGVAELTAQLRALADPKQQLSTLKAAVRNPMRKVERQARLNIAAISPGKRAMHRTYRGRLVTAGFAARSIRTIVKVSRDKQSATAILGVKAEAFYALQFLELGTAYIPATPWLLPAFESLHDEMLRGVASVMRERVERIAKMRVAEGRAPPARG